MLARGKLIKFIVAATNHQHLTEFLSKFPRNCTRHIVRTCSVGTKNKNNFDGLENDSFEDDIPVSSSSTKSEVQRSNNKFPATKRFDNRYMGQGNNNFDDEFSAESNNRFTDYGRKGGGFGERYSGMTFTMPTKEKKTYAPVEKDFYIEHDNSKNRSHKEIDAFLKENEIKATGKGGEVVVKPIFHFEEAGFPEPIQAKLKRKGFEQPTPIQRVTWPQVLAGKDVVGIAQTGSGKTLGFMLPGFVHIMKQAKVQRGEGPVCLVVVPTRELCQQVEHIAYEYGLELGLRSCVAYGGSSKLIQARKIDQSPQICIATPGRLLDFMSCGSINLDRCTYLVLDEADRMLDMGFEPQIRQIIQQTRPDRQTLMWSATWPKEIRGLASEFIGDYVEIKVGSSDLVANKDIKQEVIVCEKRDKLYILINVLKDIFNASPKDKILIFVKTKAMADEMSWKLNKDGYRNVCIHGDKSQTVRERNLGDFRSGQAKIMIATDVAARGIDVTDINFVINYDAPNTIEDYVHRIGRTGRAGKKGTSVSLLTEEDANISKDLILHLKKMEQEVPEHLIELASSSTKGNSYGGYGGGRGGGYGGGRGGRYSGGRIGGFRGGRVSGYGGGIDGGYDGGRADRYDGGRPERYGGGKTGGYGSERYSVDEDDEFGGNRSTKFGVTSRRGGFDGSRRGRDTRSKSRRDSDDDDDYL